MQNVENHKGNLFINSIDVLYVRCFKKVEYNDGFVKKIKIYPIKSY